MHSLRQIKKIAAGLGILFMTAVLPVHAEEVHQEYSVDELLKIADGIIEWKGDGQLFGKEYLKDAGYSQADWYAVVEGRLGYEDDFVSYLAATEACVSYRYEQEGQLDAVKATEWHRIALAIAALGGDPTNVGEDGIDLIADGIYNREQIAPLDAQGVNGLIWALVALDSCRYTVPADATTSREDMIQRLLEYQLPDGGFAFGAGTADPDITAMTLYALAPYYNSEKSYTYTKQTSEKTVTRQVRAVADEAIECLSKMQQESGGFFSWESDNAESIAQVVIALSAYGIDVQKDERFVKNGNTMLDALMGFRMSDGGFIHSREYDEENKDADPEQSNSMAGEQVACAIGAYCRMKKGMRSFYDFRPEQTEEVKQQIAELEEQLQNLKERPADRTEEELHKLYEAYQRIPKEERSYVYHYYLLADALAAAGIGHDTDDLTGSMNRNEHGGGTVVNVRTDETLPVEVTFEEADAQAAEQLPQTISTEYEIPVVCAIYRIEKSGKAEEYAPLLQELKQKEQQIRERKQELEQLNSEIKEQLYPFEEIGVGQLQTIQKIRKQYADMPEYDKKQIENYEDVEKAYVQCIGLVRAAVLTAAAVVIVVLLLVVVIHRSRKRRLEKQRRKISDWEKEDWDA